MPSPIIIRCGQLLANKAMTIAFAESATGGRLCAEFTLVQKAGDFLKGAFVCYDVGVKQALLGVPEEVVIRHTAESAEVTRLMALGLKERLHADVHVAITGLTHAGGSENAEKPVGTMFIHVINADNEICIRKVFQGDPEAIVLQAIDEVAVQIIHVITAD